MLFEIRLFHCSYLYSRFSKRVYIGLPDADNRITLLKKLLASQNNPLSDNDLEELASLTEYYSGSDLTALAKDAALGPIRELGPEQVKNIHVNKMRKIRKEDFLDSLQRVRKSVSTAAYASYEKWNQEYGDISI